MRHLGTFVEPYQEPAVSAEGRQKNSWLLFAHVLCQEIHAFLDRLKGSIITLEPGIKAMSCAFYKVQLSLYSILLQLRMGPLCKLCVNNDICCPLNEECWREIGCLQQLLWIHTIVLILGDDFIKLNTLSNRCNEIGAARCAQIGSVRAEGRGRSGWRRNFLKDLCDEFGGGRSRCTGWGWSATPGVVEGVTEIFETE